MSKGEVVELQEERGTEADATDGEGVARMLRQPSGGSMDGPLLHGRQVEHRHCEKREQQHEDGKSPEESLHLLLGYG